MHIKSEKLQSALARVKVVKQHEKLQCANPAFMPLDMYDLIAVIGEITNTYITVVEVDYEASFVNGMIERYEDGTVYIRVRRELSDDQKNFTTVKELCHVLIDEKTDFSPTGTETIELLIDAVNNPDKEFEENHLHSEKIAEIAAREILYPHEYRAKDMQSVASGHTTYKSLAIHYDVPEIVVSVALRPRYHDIMTSFWDSLE